MKRIAAVLLAALAFRCACECESTVAQTPNLAASVAPRTSAAAAARIHQLSPPSALAHVGRNLFAYYETPGVEAIRPMISAAPPPAVFEQPAPAAQQVAETPHPPQFPYRYIGRFGPASDPIAAFVRAGEVRTVRAGERIDEQFTLRTIGSDVVEIEARGWQEAIPVALSSAV